MSETEDRRITKAEQENLAAKLEDLKSEFLDAVDEMARAFEPIPQILREIERKTGTRVMRRDQFSEFENFFGVIGWTGCRESADDIAENIDSIIEEILFPE